MAVSGINMTAHALFGHHQIRNIGYLKFSIMLSETREALNILGWAVITVWECELKKKVREKRLEQLCAEIKGECVNGTD